MISKLINDIKNIDKSIIKLVQKSFNFAFMPLVLSGLFFTSYIFVSNEIYIYWLGMILFKASISIIVESILVGFIFDKIYITKK